MKRKWLTPREAFALRAENAAAVSVGWRNGPSLCVPQPKESGAVHPEVQKLMDTMRRNQAIREAKLLAVIEKRLAGAGPASAG